MTRVSLSSAASTAALRLAVLFGAGLGLAMPASAASFYDTWIDGGAGAPCYARVYDAAHLAAHPRQRLTRFVLRESSLGAPLKSDEFELTFAFNLKRVDDTYQSEAICRDAAVAVHCQVEGDGGDFTLRADPSGLLLTVGKFLQVEGSNSFSPDLAVGGDDRVIRLFRVPTEACRF